jgi:hypothetical protein
VARRETLASYRVAPKAKTRLSGVADRVPEKVASLIFWRTAAITGKSK